MKLTAPTARLAIALLVLAFVALAWRGLPFRELVAGIALVLAPGMAIASSANLRHPLAVALVAVPIGISLNALVATVLVYLGLLSSGLTLVVVSIVTVFAGALGDMERTSRLVLVGVAALPGLVLLAAEFARGLR